MKYAYFAIAITLLFLISSANTDPFGLKSTLVNTFPLSTFSASTGVEIEVSVKPNFTPIITELQSSGLPTLTLEQLEQLCKHDAQYCLELQQVLHFKTPNLDR